MIKKRYRLSESKIKKVLKYSKPFFSYGIILKSTSNNLNYNRFAIIISEKTALNNVFRNFFRRMFYDLVWKNIFVKHNAWKDIVFVVKKQTKLDKKDSLSIKSFKKDVNFLLKNIN